LNHQTVNPRQDVLKNKTEDLVIQAEETFLIANKPPGLPTLADGYDPAAPYLVGLLEKAYGRLWVVHRLDKETSGILLLARTPDAHRTLNTQFEKRQVVKTYHALVTGNPTWEEQVVRAPLRADGDRRHRTIVDARRGKASSTSLRLLERFGRYALVEATPHTGRTHQIRVHLAFLGHPVAADSLYGNRQGIFLSEIKPSYRGDQAGEAPLLNRVGLHAWSLEFAHPQSGERSYCEASYPQDLDVTLRQLRRHSHHIR